MAPSMLLIELSRTYLFLRIEMHSIEEKFGAHFKDIQIKLHGNVVKF